MLCPRSTKTWRVLGFAHQVMKTSVAMVTEKDAKRVAEHMVKRLDPIALVLFGSVAKTGQGRDLDLLIVVDDREVDLRRLDAAARRCLRPFAEQLTIDHFVLPRSLLRQRFLEGSPFLRLIQREGRCLYMKDAIRQWFDHAREDLAMAELLFETGHDRGACYHAQQAIEKALKGALLQAGWELERSHSLRKLAATAKRYGIIDILSEEDTDFIDSVYRGRYPAEEGLLPTGDPTHEETRRIVRAASEALARLLT